MNSPAGEPHGSKRTPLPNPIPVRRGEGEATPRSLSALIQRQCPKGEGALPSIAGNGCTPRLVGVRRIVLPLLQGEGGGALPLN